MFESDRIFSSRNPNTGVMEWFFNARDGIYGPYGSKEQTTKALKEFIQHCLNSADDGGRTKPGPGRLSIIPKECSQATKLHNSLKRKKGIESD
jgi:hypothetical protein